MKTLEEMIEETKPLALDSDGFRDVLHYLQELKQRREQDGLTLEMVDHLKLCARIARHECHGPGCGKCPKNERCSVADDWLDEQEARLKED